MYMVMIFLSVIVVVILYAVFMYMSMKVDAVENSVSPYECGFDPVMGSRVGFSYRFFLISILFLIFDVEISLLLPLPYGEFDLWMGVMTLYFLWLLMVGLIYEYYNGALSWL
uniref:NADH-ubiquinone oxidoreductase chain 3 n=1 Tax=Calisoga longitarsis TaxID=394809 RepID=B2CKV0_9ARAC|nr:NADH dehydrogenase subunit 3 [Calisoga longitarsis]